MACPLQSTDVNLSWLLFEQIAWIPVNMQMRCPQAGRQRASPSKVPSTGDTQMLNRPAGISSAGKTYIASK